MSIFGDIRKALAIYAAVKAARGQVQASEPNGAPVLFQPISGLVLFGVRGVLMQSFRRTE